MPAEHYARLARIAYLVLAPSLGRNRRVVSAHWLTQRALAAGQGPEPGQAYAYVRLRVLRLALEAGLPLLRFARPRRAQFPPLVPQVWGLRLFPHSCGADELALEQALAEVSAPCRAAHVLRGLEGLDDAEVCRVLDAVGVGDPRASLLEADGLTAPHALLSSPEFDPCSLQVRPADPARRRRQGRTLLAGAGALLVCGTLLLMPGDGLGGPSAASAPLYARHRTAQQALDPATLRRVPDGLWRTSARRDFSVWPTRGDRTGDTGLLRRALAAWARPGPAVVSSATPGTPTVRRWARPSCCTRARSARRPWCCSTTACGSCGTPSRATPTRRGGRAGLRAGGRCRRGGGGRTGGAAPGRPHPLSDGALGAGGRRTGSARAPRAGPPTVPRPSRGHGSADGAGYGVGGRGGLPFLAGPGAAGRLGGAADDGPR